MNIAEKLKDAPKGLPLYSPIFGECKLKFVTDEDVTVVRVEHGEEEAYTFNFDGTYFAGGECMLFPSKDNRDWDEFVVPSSVISVGDHVLYRGRIYEVAYTYGDGVTLAPDDDDEGEFDVPEVTEVIKLDHWDDKYFKPFDKVLVRPSKVAGWFINYFNSIRTEEPDKYVCLDDCYAQCIPYNWETRHLLGTTNEEPEFYKQIAK